MLYIYNQVIKVKPNDGDAKTKYHECNKIIKKLAFEKAISISEKSCFESIDFEGICKYYHLCKLNNTWLNFLLFIIYD